MAGDSSPLIITSGVSANVHAGTKDEDGVSSHFCRCGAKINKTNIVGITSNTSREEAPFSGIYTETQAAFNIHITYQVKNKRKSDRLFGNRHIPDKDIREVYLREYIYIYIPELVSFAVKFPLPLCIFEFD